MNERRMKTSVNAEEVPSPPAQAAGWGLKISAEHGGGTETQGFGVEQLLENPCGWEENRGNDQQNSI
jgi:hypothetical protein